MNDCACFVARAKEAKVSETMLLLRAWSAGDVSQAVRRKQRVFEIRHDSTMPLQRVFTKGKYARRWRKRPGDRGLRPCAM
jgi:hypothetical protein